MDLVFWVKLLIAKTFLTMASVKVSLDVELFFVLLEQEFMVSQACQSSRAALESVPEPSSVSPPHSDDCAQESPPDGFRSRHGSFSSLLGSEVVDSDQKEVVHNLGRHIVYGRV